MTGQTPAAVNLFPELGEAHDDRPRGSARVLREHADRLRAGPAQRGLRAPAQPEAIAPRLAGLEPVREHGEPPPLAPGHELERAGAAAARGRAAQADDEAAAAVERGARDRRSCAGTRRRWPRGGADRGWGQAGDVAPPGGSEPVVPAGGSTPDRRLMPMCSASSAGGTSTARLVVVS